jgi:hypothetical protein
MASAVRAAAMNSNKSVVGMKCAQHIKVAGKRDDEVMVGCHFLAETHFPPCGLG